LSWFRSPDGQNTSSIVRVCLNAPPEEEFVELEELEVVELEEEEDELDDVVGGTEVVMEELLVLVEDEDETEVIELDEELEDVVVAVVVMDDLAKNAPPIATIIMMTITETIAIVLEIALTLLANRTLEIKRLLTLELRLLWCIYAICQSGKMRSW
jgi:hypothetical protein